MRASNVLTNVIKQNMNVKASPISALKHLKRYRDKNKYFSKLWKFLHSKKMHTNTW